ncbi:MAG: choice-of-anchor I family protein, partial [Leptolyngbyaceae bacterium]|nr:choice-of-anchor I family protein [Leptolyngbyaceae bacterium]
DPTTQQLFVTNGSAKVVDVLDISDPTTPTFVKSLDISDYGSGLQSVAVSNDVIAVAVAADDDAGAGSVVFFSTAGEFLSVVTVGVLPDALTFTPDGSKVVVANEGEPVFDDDGVLLENPAGSISIIDVSGGAASLTDANVTTLDFSSFIGQEAALRDAGVRIAPEFTIAHDAEPEFVAVSPDSTTAYVTLQENNAVAVVDLTTGAITGIQSLGTIDYSSESALDPSDEDGVINIANFPVYGLRMADAIATYEVDGQLYYVTANEGDARDTDEARVEDLTLDPTAFPDAATLQLPENLGRLQVSSLDGDIDGDGDYDELYAYGSRSFSIYSADGTLVFDSGSAFEEITADLFPIVFNSTNDENITFDSRSAAKGPEPEGITIGEVNGVPYAFIGLERIGGIMVYDISDPTDAEFVQYINTRDFSGDPEADTAGDLGPEGLVFISAEDSPTGIPLLAVTNEISGSTSLFSIDLDPDITETSSKYNIDVTLINVEVDIVQVTEVNQVFYQFNGSSSVNIIVSTIDIDIIFAGNGGDTVICGAGDDEADGGRGNDVIRGEFGFDILIGGLGRDRIFGGSDDDDCSGDEGSDTIYGGSGDDTIDGGTQGDILYGGIGIDIIIGGNGKDYIRGGDDDDEISGGNGKDTIICEDGDDDTEGGRATDFINAGSGDDDISGDAGNDILIGGTGDDILVGGGNNDILRGGDGDDILFGDDGRDVCIGGDGDDTFVLQDTILFSVIRDFEIGVDFFGISAEFSFESFSFTQVGVDTVVRYESSTVAVVQNIEVTSITEEFFVTVEV